MNKFDYVSIIPTSFAAGDLNIELNSASISIVLILRDSFCFIIHKLVYEEIELLYTIKRIQQKPIG